MPDAELVAQDRDHYLAIFLDAYNRLYGTNYAVEGLVTPADNSCDYEIRADALPPLKLQWTRASTEPKERITPKEAEAVAQFLRTYLDQRCIVGVSVGLTFKSIPSDADAKSALAWAIAYLAQSKSTQMCGTSMRPLFEYDERDWPYPMSIIANHCSQLAIGVFADSLVPASQLLRYSAAGVVELTTPDVRARNALLKKERRYGGQATDLVLVIHYDVDPYVRQEEVSRIQSELQSHTVSFKEVWILRDTLVPPPSADRVLVRPTEHKRGTQANQSGNSGTA